MNFLQLEKDLIEFWRIMSNFVELLSEALEERQKSFKDLENDGIISKRAFYQYKTYTPFLPAILKIVNYLKFSLDYFANRVSKNYFKTYKIEQTKFFEKLKARLKNLEISQTQLCNELNIGRTNFSYWKNGSLPKLHNLIDIANYLNCDIDDLLEHD